MRWGQLKEALLETAKLTVMIFTIIWGVLIYVRFLGFANLPSAFSDWITSLHYSPWTILVCILLAYAVLGMFMDAIGMLLLTLPVVYPAVMALNGGEFVSAADSTFGMSGPMCAIWFGILVEKDEYSLVTINQQGARARLAEMGCTAFARGTHITMADGAQCRIENLRPGDRVLTRDDGPQAIRWVGGTTVRAVGAMALSASPWVFSSCRTSPWCWQCW